MLVSEIGEFGLIEVLSREIGVPYPPVRGSMPRHGLMVDIGDDAVVSQRRDGALIWTTDTMVAGGHFLPGVTSWESAGWKALAVNLSDIAAMGGTPHLALVTLALPADFGVEDATALYRGLQQCAAAYDVTIGGGDIVRSPVFSVTVALAGWAYQPQVGDAQVMTRSRAQVGDIVAVTGELGRAAAGLRLLIERFGIEENAAAAERLRHAQERPIPRIQIGKAAVRNGIRCAIDVSDGLVQDLRHIVRASNAGIRIDANRIPVGADLHDVFPGRGLGFALAGGEDYELVLVGARGAIEDLMSATDVPITEIGEVVHFREPRLAVIDEAGRELPMGAAPGGWDHFATS